MSHDHDHTHDHHHSHGDADHTHGHGHHHHDHAASERAHATAVAASRAARADLTGLSSAELADAYEQAWTTRRQATETIIALTEESIARLVAENLPTAREVVLYEDHSHDAPHAHVRHVLDATDAVILAANGDDWHDLEWTSEVDELVWDLYHLDRAGFRAGPDGRLRHIPVTSP